MDFETGKIISPTESVRIICADMSANPFIISSPHSGCYYPEEFLHQSILPVQQLRLSEDAYVDEILMASSFLGVPMVAANLPRVFVDVNRSAYELDRSMFSDELPDFIDDQTDKVRSGYGTIPKMVRQGMDIYAHRLKFADERYRIELYYREYHKKLLELINRARGEFGRAVMFDFHSMPSASAVLRSYGWDSETDVVIGDNKGRSCSPDIVLKVEKFLEKKGLRTTRNKPFSGGFITTNYGNPSEGCSVLQIEINRRLYMDEDTFEKQSTFRTLSNIFAGMFEELIVSI